MGAFVFLAVELSAAAACVAFAIYQYRRGATFTLKYGWRTREEYPVTFWWGIFITAFMALVCLAPSLTALMGL